MSPKKKTLNLRAMSKNISMEMTSAGTTSHENYKPIDKKTYEKSLFMARRLSS